MMDGQGGVWFTARIRPPKNPDYCKNGEANPSAGVAPLAESARQLSMYDPKTDKWTLIDTCFTTHHLYFGHDANDTLWLSAAQDRKSTRLNSSHANISYAVFCLKK